jgi:hypothetical protein
MIQRKLSPHDGRRTTFATTKATNRTPFASGQPTRLTWLSG